ncbi:tetratricopeptide repeat protein [Roseovarius indicus]|uniref:tetratricopeptide repeat protein n=1 Tax=Roseovarius indicus TaxID=540747 RepID=UPI0007DA3DBE|nr:tetratricopeptide repeat protein [Roseovarius indicus]OAO00132.1 hypothetical protein A8B76_19190 [Roseovarius indicus]
MSTFEKIAEGSSDICVGALALLWGDPSGTATVAAGLAGLGILGLSLRRGCAETAGRTAAARTIAALKASPEFADADLTRAEALLADRPGHATLTPHTLVEAAKAPTDAARTEALAEALYARIPFDGDDARTHRLLRLALQSAMRACYDNPELQTRITREVLIDTARQTDGAVEILERVEEKTDEVLRRLGGIETVLTTLEAQSAGDLQLIAGAFGATEAMSKPALVEFLTKKGTEYRALRQEIDAIEDGYKRLSNLKTAAREAIAAMRLDEVEEILSRVQEVELEEAAKTSELRAENALLRGRTDQAYRILSAAADSFAAVDPWEPARRRFEYMQPLYLHGQRYGGSGMARAIDMLRAPALERLREADPVLWGKAQNNLALAQSEQGKRTDGQQGAALLAEAVAAFRKALTIRTRENHPVDWALTQNNLANALQEQGRRTGGPQGAMLLAEAVATYKEVLTIFTREDRPVDWALTQNNLSFALQEQGSRTAGSEGTTLLSKAVATYRQAHSVCTREDYPKQWAHIQNNLATALQVQGIRTGGPQGAMLLAEAVVASQQASSIFVREFHPVGWAMTQTIMAQTEEALADQDTTTDPTPHLRAALEHIEAALTVYDPEHMAERHAIATALRERLRARLAP